MGARAKSTASPSTWTRQEYLGDSEALRSKRARGVLEEEERCGAQKFVYQQRPDKIFPNVNFVCFRRWSLWSEEGGGVSSCDVRPF